MTQVQESEESMELQEPRDLIEIEVSEEIFLEHLSYPYEHPAKAEPAWSAQVDRWYQLDSAAYGLVEAYSQWKLKGQTVLGGKSPDWMLHASPAASNETDRQFAKSGGLSPSKFSHTLPNIRLSPLCQVMGWAGPVISIHRDPHSLVLALREGVDLLSADIRSVWIFSVWPSHIPGSTTYTTHGLFLSKGVFSAYPAQESVLRSAFKVFKPAIPETTHPFDSYSGDLDFLLWLEGRTKENIARPQEFLLPGHYHVSQLRGKDV